MDTSQSSQVIRGNENFDLERDVQLRLMVPDDVDQAVRCFSDHYDVFDAPVTVQVFQSISPEWCFVATLTTKEEPSPIIGVICAPVGPQSTAFIGLYGVRRDFRGRGIGGRLFHHVMERTQKLATNVGLYAVPEMRQKYIDSGFRQAEGIFMVNCVGAPTDERLASLLANLANSADGNPLIRHLKPVALGEAKTGDERDLLQRIIVYDEKIQLESRARLLENALQRSDYLTSVALDRNDVQGYACLRQHAHTGRYMLGPVYADTPEIAKALVGYLLALVPKSELFTKGLILNAISAQPSSITLATEWLGLEEIERCERLFQKSPFPYANYRLIYSVFSPDFSL